MLTGAACALTRITPDLATINSLVLKSVLWYAFGTVTIPVDWINTLLPAAYCLVSYTSPRTVTPLNSAPPSDLRICQPLTPATKLSDCKFPDIFALVILASPIFALVMLASTILALVMDASAIFALVIAASEIFAFVIDASAICAELIAALSIKVEALDWVI